MPQKYFEKFPIITYANTEAVDITERVIIADSTLNNPAAFQVYDISNDIRPDQLAKKSYDDPFYSWLIYMGNNITDPYYEWYLTENQFNDYIVAKYGSIESATIKTKYYINDWVNQSPISISEYDALPDILKSYWEPQYSMNNSIMNYARRQEGIIVNTNKIIAYEIEPVSNTAFNLDEIVTINFSTEYNGQGQVLFANSSMIYVQHVSGDVLEGTPEGGTANNIPNVRIIYGSHVYGTESGANALFFSATSYADNLDPLEEGYFAPVSYYTYEQEKNEGNKSIELIQNTYAYPIALKLKDALK